MFSVRTVLTPWFGSQQGSSQRGEPQPDQTRDQAEARSRGQRAKRGNKRGKAGAGKTRSVLTVKLPKVNKRVKRKDKTARGWVLECTTDKTRSTVSRGGGGGATLQYAGADSARGDVFLFSQRTTSKATNEKEKAKLAVLRTISKVLKENQLIRQRLASLSQAN